MKHVGMDVAKSFTQIAFLDDETGELKEGLRIRTRRERLRTVFEGLPRCKVLIEASTGSEWIARLVENLGHEVVVVDPNYEPMYADRKKGVKNDRLDARALAMASSKGTYKATHRLSDRQRLNRVPLGSRKALVDTRTRLISLVTAILWGEGIEVKSGSAENFVRRVEAVEVPEALKLRLTEILRILNELEASIAVLTRDVKKASVEDAEQRRLTTMPCIGPITAATAVATLDQATRFNSASQVASFVGLVPREYSSGDRVRRGSITKIGPKQLRSLLISAAHGIMRRRIEAMEPLREWAHAIAVRRGTARAAVALARKLARILFAMWRDQVDFDPARLKLTAATVTPAAG